MNYIGRDMKKYKGFLEFLMYFILFLAFLQYQFSEGGEEEKIPFCEDITYVDPESHDREHQRAWLTVTHRDAYCLDYATNKGMNTASKGDRTDFLQHLPLTQNPWTEVYRNLIAYDFERVSFLADSLGKIGRKEKLDRSELAELVVSFVQDIPYYYVLPIDCKDFRTEGRPCIGRVAYGIFSPYEFIHDLKGDCDTRSVLIYALLEHLGFTPMIVVSDEYAHAMIALNLPATGDFLMYKKQKYYFWETTAKGWQIGMLPPNAGNVAYWKISLADGL